METRPKKIFYGWWVVLTAATGLLLGYAPIFVFSFGVFVKSMVKEFHSNRTQISLAFTLANVMFSVSSPVAGRLVDRFGARRVILPGTLIFGLLLISFKFISTSLWQLYVIFLALFLKDSPKEKGLLPDGGVDFLAQSEERPEKQGLTWSTARSSSTFWLMACGFSLVGASVHACVIHLVSMLTDRGVSAENAAMASSALGVALLLGRVGSGYVLDRVFAPYVAIFFFSGVGCGLSLLWVGAGGAAAFLGASLVGLGMGAEGDLIAYLTSRYFGLRSFGEIYGYLFSALTLSGALRSLLMAMGFDRAGSYRLPLAFFLIATVTAAVLMTRLGQYRFRPA